MRLVNADAVVIELYRKAKKAFKKGDMYRSGIYEEVAKIIDKMQPATMADVEQFIKKRTETYQEKAVKAWNRRAE